MITKRALAAFALTIALTAPALATDLTGRASAIDGDTIEIHGTRIRLYGIDAPESRQLCTPPTGKKWRCGQAAALALDELIGRATVRCEPRDHDRYQRDVAVCFIGAEDIGRWMVANGWAVAYRKCALDYTEDEDRARGARLNLWSGRFDMPWDWRASRRNN